MNEPADDNVEVSTENQEDQEKEEKERKPFLVGALVRQKYVMLIVVHCPQCGNVFESTDKNVVEPLVFHGRKLEFKCRCGADIDIHVPPAKNPALVRPKSGIMKPPPPGVIPGL